MAGMDFEISNQTLIALVLALAVGFGVGYYLYAALNVPAVNDASNLCSVGGTTTEAFTPDLGKIGEISSMFQDIIYLQTGTQHSVQYQSYRLQGDLVALDFLIDGAYPQTLYVTKDFKYLLQQPTDFNILKQQVANAKAEMEAQLEEAKKPVPKSSKPEVLLFVMSFCPYGNVAENGMVDVIALLGDKIAFEPVYILSGSNGKYSALHGVEELNQNIREKIVFNKYGAKKWVMFTYDVNMNCTLQNAGTCWKEAAVRQGIDVAAVQAEFDKNFNEIADREVALGVQYSVQSSPTLMVNGKTFNGARSADAFKQFLCSGFSVEPDECKTALSTAEGVATGSCG